MWHCIFDLDMFYFPLTFSDYKSTFISWYWIFNRAYSRCVCRGTLGRWTTSLPRLKRKREKLPVNKQTNLTVSRITKCFKKALMANKKCQPLHAAQQLFFSPANEELGAKLCLVTILASIFSSKVPEFQHLVLN